ncbi:hypothetical protein DC3_18440 [Deinococcus cellulosilyticus NBRC 106333 = KACC 11606]|uniref:Uncharacterized protein n=1 Tax=Deinococcus cellulosilyticus (strain DSM 18568 / NBRC 106333 / KACC 11606 / 5516J-15) TaxID=1223518 RepID=A0A511N068_DEIC1|nr:hypothetical protein DC3_18440 [Deinococcus cellulosilyticus NBRC 106333 = KACC 11606]
MVVLVVFLVIADVLVMKDELDHVLSPRTVHQSTLVDAPPAFPRGAYRVRPVVEIAGQQITLDAVMKPEDVPPIGKQLEVSCTASMRCRPEGFWSQYGFLINWILPGHLVILGLLVWHLRFGAFREVKVGL